MRWGSLRFWAEHDEEGDDHYPRLYTVFDLRYGTQDLLKLPDKRGEKESFYRKLADSENSRAKGKSAAPPVQDPMKPSIGYADLEFMENFVRRFEDEKVLRYFRAMNRYNSRNLDEDLEEAILLLKLADEPIPAEDAPDWRESIMRTASDQLKSSKVALNNSNEDVEIQAELGKYGFDGARIAEGLTYYDEADKAVSATAAALGTQKLATENLKAARKSAEDAYQALSGVAKVVLKGNEGALTKLGLNRAMPRVMAPFISAGNILFGNALGEPDIKAKLAGRGYTQEKLTAEHAKIAAYDDADDKQEAAKGAYQQAASIEAAALKRLNDWMSEFRKIAKIALKDKKNLLEKLGIKVRSVKTAAQRKAPAKAAATRAAKKNSQ